jgi:hypothetical protein
MLHDHTLREIRARGRDARRRLLQSWHPSGRMSTGPEETVQLIEAAVWARAAEMAERAGAVPGDSAAERIVTALREEAARQSVYTSPPPRPP